VGYRQQSLTLIAQLMNHSRTRENPKTFHRLDDLRRRLPEETERELTDRECCDILRRLDIQSLLEPLIKPLKDCIQACDEGDTRGMLDSAHKSLRYAVECHNAPGRAAGSTYLAIAKFNAGQIYNALRACDDAIAIHASSPHWEARYGQATAAYAAARICGHQEIAFARLAAERIRRALGAYRLSIVLLQPLTPLYTDLEALCNEIRIRRDAMADL
jgi:hypothetical protein